MCFTGPAAPPQRANQADEAIGYGKGYRYAHDEADAVADMDCLPENLQGRQFYRPTERGFEKEIKRRLEGWKEIKHRRKTDDLAPAPPPRRKTE